MTSLPIIDISPFNNDNTILLKNKDDSKSYEITPQQRQTSLEIRQACLSHGFFYVKNHGISKDLIQSMFDKSRELFDLPTQQKALLSSKNSKLFRGYISTSDGLHTCNSSMKDVMGLDQKESYTMGAEDDDDKDITICSSIPSPMHGPNQWPEEEMVQGFKSIMKQYWNAQMILCRLIARGLALSLNLDLHFFDPFLTDPVAQMVLLKYPPPKDNIQESGESSACSYTTNSSKHLGCGEHTDCGFLTILAQDAVPGLEVKDATHGWIKVPPIDDCFVVNLGDMAARWTNDRFKSTFHRVYNCSNQTRYSVPFFCNCNFDAPVECIMEDGSNDDSNTMEAKYEKTTAGVYILEKLGLMRKM